VAEHYDGDTWQPTPLPDDLEDINAISAVSATGPWMIADTADRMPVTMRWDGSAWRRLDLPRPAVDASLGVAARGGSSPGPDDAWATGVLTYQGVEPGAVLWHWNGRRWCSVTVDAPDDSLTGLAADGDHGVWIVSSGIRPSADLLHYSAGDVTREAAPTE